MVTEVKTTGLYLGLLLVVPRAEIRTRQESLGRDDGLRVDFELVPLLPGGIVQ